METPFFFYYTSKRSILLENQLVIVTEDGIFNGALVKLQHCRTLPIPAMFGNVKSCLKLLPLPFALPLQQSFRLPPHFKLPVPRAFLHPFLHIFETVFCNNSCNFTKQLWLSYPSLIALFEFAKAAANKSTIGSSCSSRGFGVYSISRPCERAIKIHFSRHILSKVILGLFFLLIFFSGSGARTVGRGKRNVC